MRKAFPLWWLVLWMAACQPAPPPPSSIVDSDALIVWDRNPAAIVFRAEAKDSEADPFIARNAVPTCTIYGDNHVVWVNRLGTNQSEVLEDRLTDEQVIAFVNGMALEMNFYSYPLEGATLNGLPARTLTLQMNINAAPRQSDNYGGWNGDYYDEAVRRCAGLSLTPVLYEPTAGWVSAQPLGQGRQGARLRWDEQANGLSLSELASGDRRWLNGGIVPALWRVLRMSPDSVVFDDGTGLYRLALEVPGITLNAPAAPSS